MCMERILFFGDYSELSCDKDEESSLNSPYTLFTRSKDTYGQIVHISSQSEDLYCQRKEIVIHWKLEKIVGFSVCVLMGEGVYVCVCACTHVYIHDSQAYFKKIMGDILLYKDNG